MYAFVNGVTPLARRGFAGQTLAQRAAAVRPAAAKGTITMVKSRAMPFMNAPPALDGTRPGDNGFDPLGLTRIFDIRWMQESEIKHCRICMLAVLGFIVQEVYTFPPSYFPKDQLPASGSLHDYFVRTGGFGQLNLWVSIAEVFNLIAITQTLQGKRQPGYFGFDPLGFAKTEEAMKRWQTAELVNGRLAMCAIGGFIHQQWIYKQGVLEQLFHFKTLY